MATKTEVTFKPLGNRVVIKPNEGDEQVSAGGIYIPDTAKEKPQEGEVLAVGPGKVTDDGTRQTPDLKEGNRILFAKYAGTEVKVDGEDLLIMREDDVLAVVK